MEQEHQQYNTSSAMSTVWFCGAIKVHGIEETTKSKPLIDFLAQWLNERNMCKVNVNVHDYNFDPNTTNEVSLSQISDADAVEYIGVLDAPPNNDA